MAPPDTDAILKRRAAFVAAAMGASVGVAPRPVRAAKLECVVRDVEPSAERAAIDGLRTMVEGFGGPSALLNADPRVQAVLLDKVESAYRETGSPLVLRTGAVLAHRFEDWVRLHEYAELYVACHETGKHVTEMRKASRGGRRSGGNARANGSRRRHRHRERPARRASPFDDACRVGPGAHHRDLEPPRWGPVSENRAHCKRPSWWSSHRHRRAGSGGSADAVPSAVPVAADCRRRTPPAIPADRGWPLGVGLSEGLEPRGLLGGTLRFEQRTNITDSIAVPMGAQVDLVRAADTTTLGIAAAPSLSVEPSMWIIGSGVDVGYAWRIADGVPGAGLTDGVYVRPRVFVGAKLGRRVTFGVGVGVSICQAGTRWGGELRRMADRRRVFGSEIRGLLP